MTVSLSTTLSLYIARHFLLWFVSVLLGIIGIIYLAETIELLRRIADNEQLGLSWALGMAALKTPFTAQEVLPFTVLASGLGAYWQLTRSNELVVARASGVSVWQFLMPALVVVLMIGAIRVMAVDPLAAAMMGRFEYIFERDERGGSSLATASENGLWLRQAGSQGQSIIHAARIAPENQALQQVTILSYTPDDRFVARIDAPKARLADGFWTLEQARITRPDAPTRREDRYRMATNMSFDQIADGFTSSRALSFWDLPRYIEVLEKTGLPTRPHRLQLHRLIATPLLLCAMVLLAATFALRPQRRGGAALLIGAGTLSGFLLYFLSDIVFALGLTSSIPLPLAAWTPAGVSTMLGIAMLLHLEDG
ncbi:LPS export ABC transporter permease LptG [Rhodospirillaceae bacterium SYSU D60014]|uniref:LPS export ABC transporter permease LptG n=1 Tax=Virgifigura deserti TaxID=2268457 RepID=UPI000E674811